MSSNAEYMRQYRSSHPSYVQRNRKFMKARRLALQALGREHPEEFRRLYLTEVARLQQAGELDPGLETTPP